MTFEFMNKGSNYNSPKILSQHVDTLVITLKATNEKNYTNYLKKFNNLNEYKKKAQDIESFDKNERYIEDKFFGHDFGKFRLQAQGMGQYKFILQNDDILIFMSSAKFGTDAPQIKIELRAHYLFCIGHIKAYKQICTLADYLIGKERIDRVQRIDLASDVMGVGLDILDKVRFQNSFTNTVNSRGSKITGLSFGGGDFMFRIYDKIEEIKQSFSKHYVKRKWVLNGYEENNTVLRFEVQYRTEELKKLTHGNVSNVNIVFKSLGSLWVKGLTKIKYAPLTNTEAFRISSTEITQSTKRDIYKKARDDNDRFQFGTFLRKWECEINELPYEYIDIKKPKEQIASKQLLGFIGSTYKCGDTSPTNLLRLLEETEMKLQRTRQISMHEYGLSKVLDSFVKRQKQLIKYGVSPEHDFSMAEQEAYRAFKVGILDINKHKDLMPNIAKSDNLDYLFGFYHAVC